jgi:predicted Na+-dependent transporter
MRIFLEFILIWTIAGKKSESHPSTPNMKKVILSLLLPLILGQVYGQDVSISVTNARP